MIDHVAHGAGIALVAFGFLLLVDTLVLARVGGDAWRERLEAYAVASVLLGVGGSLL